MKKYSAKWEALAAKCSREDSRFGAADPARGPGRRAIRARARRGRVSPATKSPVLLWILSKWASKEGIASFKGEQCDH